MVTITAVADRTDDGRALLGFNFYPRFRLAIPHSENLLRVGIYDRWRVLVKEQTYRVHERLARKSDARCLSRRYQP
jgi:hypothetical protein